MKDVNLLVMVDRSSPASRAYLTYLKSAGFKPEAILVLDILRPSSKTNLLKSILGEKLVAYVLRIYRFLIFKYRLKEQAKLIKIMGNHFDIKVNFFGLFNYGQFSDRVDRLIVEGLEDPKLLDYFSNSEIKTILFTGGGILKPELLNVDGVKFIHIHPGIVPDVKGSDGPLWSMLLKRKLGYSGFYMSDGIDTGEVFIRKEYRMPKFKVYDLIPDVDLDTVYMAFLSCFDVHLRAITLVNLIEFVEDSGFSLNKIPGEVQDESEGRTYFFMHKNLRDFVLSRIIN